MKNPLRFLALPVLFVLGALSAPARLDRNFDTPRELQQESCTLVRLLQEVHYNRDAVKPADYAQLIPDFMGELDGQRLFFLRSDRDAFLDRYGQALVWNLGTTGKLDAAFEIYSVYEKRAEDRIHWIFTELDKKFDFTTRESYFADRSKGPWPATQKEADALWRRRLKFELLQDVLNKKPLAEARKNIRRRYEHMLKNLDEIEAGDIGEIFLSSLARLYDPHSSYFSPETFEDFSIQMRLSLVGIGALLGSEDSGECVIKEIIPGGPADLSGQFHVNDKILAVTPGPGAEPVDIFGMRLRKVVELIRGQKNTKVILTIQPAAATDSSTRKDITLVRDVVKLNQSRAHAALYEVSGAGNGTLSIGVITLPSFYGQSGGPDENTESASASKDIAELISRLNAAGAKALVLDLRRNGGGLLSEAIEITGLFIRQGPVVQVKSYDGDIKVDRDDDPHLAYRGPLAVLVSRFSASASEIVAGALQNYGRAIVIGDSSTHGKGSVQQMIEMKNLIPRLLPSDDKTGAVKLTIQKFYLPNGASTQKKGVVPDIVLPSVDDYLPIGESDLPHALSWDEIRPVPLDGAPLASGILHPLKEASLARQASLDEFAFLKQNIAWFRTKQAQKAVSLNLGERRAQKTEDDAFHKKMKHTKELLAKTDFPCKEFILGTPPKPKVEKPPADLKKPDGDEETDEPETDEPGTPPKLDIPLRESLRVLADALHLSNNLQLSANDHAPLTAQAEKKS